MERSHWTFVYKQPSQELKKRLERQIVDVVLLLADKLKIKKAEFLRMLTCFIGLASPLWIERSSRETSYLSLSDDLNKSIEEIRLDFRKSYKPLVNKALREWKVDIWRSSE